MLGKWNFQRCIYRLKYVLGRYFEVPTSIISLSRGPWPLMTFKICVIKVKYNTILLYFTQSEVQQKCFQLHNFTQSKLYGFKDMPIHFLNFGKKTLIWLRILLITGIAFSELKAEKKQLVLKIKIKCCFVKISILTNLLKLSNLSCRRISGLSRERSGGGYSRIPSRIYFSL